MSSLRMRFWSWSLVVGAVLAGVLVACSKVTDPPNPRPSLSTVSPDTIVVGGIAVSLQVTGANFVHDAVLRWNGADRPTTFLGGHLLAATITAADIAQIDTATVAVFNPAPGGGVSNTIGVAVVAPRVIPVTVVGNRIEWTSDRLARASVRYGFAPNELDHLAYPDAAGRRDRAYELQHSIALLDVALGRKVYFRTMNESQGLLPAVTALDSFVATTGPVPNQMLSTMIHIGFGDSHLITFPTTGKHFLIDSGEQLAEISVETYLNAHSVTRIDYMMATHIHLDHLGGVIGPWGNANGVLWTFPPSVFFDSASKSSGSTASGAYRELIGSMPPGTRRVELRRFDTSTTLPDLRIDPEVRILCLNSGTPTGVPPTGDTGDDANNESIVLRFSYGDVDFVIGGDAEQPAEGSMLVAFAPEDLEVEFAKMHHHGLPDASRTDWINTLRPRVGFIPNTDLVWVGDFVGAISSTSSKLTSIGAHIYVVDEALALDRPRSSGRQHNTTFATDGRSYEVRVEVATQPTPTKPDPQSDCRDGHGAR